MKVRDQIGRRRKVTLLLPELNSENGQSDSNRGSKRRFEDLDDGSEDEFRGFTPSPERPLPASRELHPRILQPQETPTPDSSRILRRSTRLKKKKIHEDFVYST